MSSLSLSPSRHPPSEFEFRAAVALNNMAVTMMERRCYREAFETFKDAVVAMKIACLASNSNNSNNSVEEEADHETTELPSDNINNNNNNNNARQQILSTLKCANHRASRPKLCKSQRANIPLHFVNHNDDNTTHGCAEAVPTTSHGSTEGPAALTLIRISTDDVEVFEFTEQSNSTSSDLITVILLYNFGVAYMCRSQLSDRDSSRQKFQTGGLKLLHFCRGLLDSLYETNHDPFLYPRTLFLSAVMLQTLLLALRSAAPNEKEEIKSCLSSLASLRCAARSFVEEHRQCLAGLRVVVCSFQTAAAAA